MAAIRKRVTIEQWITTALADSDKPNACSAISLVFLRSMGGQEEIHTRDLKGPQNARALAEFFADRACGYAQDMAGYQNFKLLAFYGQTEPQASWPFRTLDGQLCTGEETTHSKHEPTPAGMQAQLMKHNEVLMQMNTAMVTAFMTDGLQLRKELAEATVLVRDAIMSFATAGHQNQLALRAYERETHERQMFAQALPSMINHLTGREIMPDNFALGKALESMAERIGPNELQLLVQMGKVTAQEAQVLAAHFTKVREEKEAARKLLEKIPGEESILSQLNGGGKASEAS